MQGAGNGGAAEAEGGEGSAAGRGSLDLSRRVGRKRSGRLGCACPRAKGSGREAFSGAGPRREAARCPLRWEPPYRVKEGPHRPERTNHCWCTVGRGAACRRWGSLRQLPKTRIMVEGHSAADQRGLQLFAAADSCLHSRAVVRIRSGLTMGVSAPSRPSVALPFLDHLLSDVRQLASSAVGGEQAITSWDPVETLLRRVPSPYIVPQPGGMTTSAVPTLCLCHPGECLGPPESPLCRNGA